MKKIVNYKVGCNFDMHLLDAMIDLNKQYENTDKVIGEFYGSDRKAAYLTARPDFRLPDIKPEYFAEFVKKSNDANIQFNYTMNSIFPGTKEELCNKKNEIQDFIRFLEKIGVSRLTIANPIMMQIVRECLNIDVEASTILHIDTITQIKFLKEKYNVTKICSNLLKNRHIRFLKNAADFCNKNGILYEVMVNEFCGAGGIDYLTHCVYRDSCYLYHATNKTKEDALLFDGYPMEQCIFSRNSDALNWLRARFIRPQDIRKYVDIGINHFKITGRTGGTDYLIVMAKSYMEEKWEGNLLTLWKPLETIYNDQNELDFKQQDYIDCVALDGFIDFWFDNPDIDCALEVCGETCTYCKDFYNKIVG